MGTWWLQLSPLVQAPSWPFHDTCLAWLTVAQCRPQHLPMGCLRKHDKCWQPAVAEPVGAVASPSRSQIAGGKPGQEQEGLPAATAWAP